MNLMFLWELSSVLYHVSKRFLIMRHECSSLMGFLAKIKNIVVLFNVGLEMFF